LRGSLRRTEETPTLRDGSGEDGHPGYTRDGHPHHGTAGPPDTPSHHAQMPVEYPYPCGDHPGHHVLQAAGDGDQHVQE
jgi:hypothetical protein